ncbi:MAG TPA: hypothetical protein VJ044_18020, partial [Candidatus Hodarchaeales archaeon]|nr:hypothetical protein [Candidatus Hodarchaeales archaeon]
TLTLQTDSVSTSIVPENVLWLALVIPFLPRLIEKMSGGKILLREIIPFGIVFERGKKLLGGHPWKRKNKT